MKWSIVNDIGPCKSARSCYIWERFLLSRFTKKSVSCHSFKFCSNDVSLIVENIESLFSLGSSNYIGNCLKHLKQYPPHPKITQDSEWTATINEDAKKFHCIEERLILLFFIHYSLSFQHSHPNFLSINFFVLHVNASFSPLLLIGCRPHFSAVSRFFTHSFNLSMCRLFLRYGQPRSNFVYLCSLVRFLDKFFILSIQLFSCLPVLFLKSFLPLTFFVIVSVSVLHDKTGIIRKFVKQYKSQSISSIMFGVWSLGFVEYCSPSNSLK